MGDGVPLEDEERVMDLDGEDWGVDSSLEACLAKLAVVLVLAIENLKDFEA